MVEIVERIPRDNTSLSVITPMDMLNNAVMSGADISVLEKLMGLQERWEANQARKLFDAAIADAKGAIPPIFKNSVVDYTSAKGRTNYRFESLAEIARVIDPILHDFGLTYRFRSEQNGTRLRVICILSHKDGYSEETSLEASEDNSGNKNAIQAIGSAATYLQRYTLKLALGLSTTLDDDGRATSVKTSPVEDQSLELIKANGRRIATEEGMTALGTWWTKDLTAQQRKDLGTAVLVELKAIAEGVN
jgi:hypothetical protein